MHFAVYLVRGGRHTAYYYYYYYSLDLITHVFYAWELCVEERGQRPRDAAAASVLPAGQPPGQQDKDDKRQQDNKGRQDMDQEMQQQQVSCPQDQEMPWHRQIAGQGQGPVVLAGEALGEAHCIGEAYRGPCPNHPNHVTISFTFRTRKTGRTLSHSAAST